LKISENGLGFLGILQERTGSLKIPHGERELSVIE
jgi:hypothetical protein